MMAWFEDMEEYLEYDAEKTNNFISTLQHEQHKYAVKADALYNALNRYCNNDTFVGESADTTKRYIHLVWKKYVENIDTLQKSIYKQYCDMADTFSKTVDSSPKARIKIPVLKKVRSDYREMYDSLEYHGRNIMRIAQDLQDKFGKYGEVTQPNYHRAMDVFDEFCGTGGFLDKCIKKMVEFDDYCANAIDKSGLKDRADNAVDRLFNSKYALSGMTVYDPSVEKTTVTMAALQAGAIKIPWLKGHLPIKLVKEKNQYKEVEIKAFLDKNGIKVNKLQTKDGYFIIDKSICEIFEEAGVDSNVVDVKSYDDWYITGLTKEDGSIVYSIIKVREPMDEQGAKAIAVPFNSMKISNMEQIIDDTMAKKEVSNEVVKAFSKDIDTLSHASDHWMKHDDALLKYFKDSKSEGNYLIADFAIDKIAHNEVFKGGGVYKLPFKYEEFDDYGGRETLDYLSSVGVYDKKANSITIKDPDNLTEDERTALLLIQTGDRDAYAYAAENQFHAKAYDDPVYIAFKSHAIASDAAVGESKGLWYEKDFKLPEGHLYKEQYEIHNKEGK